MSVDFGALVISLDFEIHWGGPHLWPLNGSYRGNLLGVRRAVPRILDLFEEYDIAATWATVGFLFAATRRELEGFSPYQVSLGNGEEDDPFHYAPSLIDAISKRARQEIGTHTFSHYYCLERGQDRAAFKADLRSAVAIARKHGFQLRSIVFPRNQFNPDYADLLLEAGIICYRGNARNWMYKASEMHAQKLYMRCARLLDHYLDLSGSNLSGWDDLLERNGLTNVASSRFLRHYTPCLRHFDSLRLGRIVNGIQKAAVSGSIYHLAWHPHNFGSYTDENIAFLRKILEAFSRSRERYRMRSLNMREVAEIANSRAQMQAVQERR